MGAGAAAGETDVALQLAKEPFLTGTAGIDNYGVHSTGSTRASASLGLASPLGIGDFLGASIIHSQGSDYLRGEYTAPVGVQGLRLGVNGSVYRYDIVTAPFDALEQGKITLQTEYPVSENAWRTGGAPSRTSAMFAPLNTDVTVEDLIQGAKGPGADAARAKPAPGLARHQAFPDVVRILQQYVERKVHFADGTDVRELGMQKYAKQVCERVRDGITAAVATKNGREP